MTQTASTHNASFHSAEHDRHPVSDPDRVAYFEKAGWEAYYDRKWLRVLRLMVQLNREQFGMSLPTAIAASIHVVRASLAFAPVDNDVSAATEHLRRYYEKARRSAGLKADAPKLAALEMNYWVVHRKLAIERRQTPITQATSSRWSSRWLACMQRCSTHLRRRFAAQPIGEHRRLW